MLVVLLTGTQCMLLDPGGSPDGDVVDAGAEEGDSDAGPPPPPPPPDTEPPVITFLAPVEDCLAGEITFEFRVVDEGAGVGFVSATYAARNLMLESLDDGTYRGTYDTSSLIDGPHDLKVQAIDLDNNVAEGIRVYGTLHNDGYFETESFACGEPPPPPDEDLAPPSLEILDPSGLFEVFASRQLTVSVRVTDDVGPVTVVARVGGLSVELSGAAAVRTASIDVSSLPEGSASLTVTATDAAGRATEDSRAFSIDHTPPSVVITEPQSGETRIAFTDVVCQANDENGVVKVSLYEVGDPTPLGVATMPSTADTYGIIYQLPCDNFPRDTAFEMRVEDAAGNLGSAQVDVTLTSTGCQ